MSPPLSNKKREEKALLEKCRKGDLEAFDRLIRENQDLVYNVAFKLLGNEDDAFDLSQEVFLTFFRKIKSFRAESALSTWLYRVTVNRARNFRKTKHKKRESRTASIDQPVPGYEEENLTLQLENHNPGPDKISADRQSLDILREKIRELPHEFAEVIVLRFNEHMSYDEIADVLECSLGTVKSRINRARKLLREKMEPFL